MFVAFNGNNIYYQDYKSNFQFDEYEMFPILFIKKCFHIKGQLLLCVMSTKNN